MTTPNPFHMPHPAGSPHSIAWAITHAFIPTVAVTMRETPERLQRVEGRWNRLWRFLTGKPTWELQPMVYAAEFTVICDHKPTDNERQAVEDAVENMRPAGILVKVDFALAIR